MIRHSLHKLIQKSSTPNVSKHVGRMDHSMTQRGFRYSSSLKNYNSNHELINAVGLAGAFASVTSIIAILPLDELRQKDPNNFCYHRHLHPR